MKGDNVAFFMICPDAVLRNVTKEIVSDLQKTNVKPILWDIRFMPDFQLEGIYLKYLQPEENWWLTSKLYSLSPAIPMLLYGDPKPFDSLSKKMLEFKGSSVEGDGENWAIRQKYRLPNSLLGLVHSSDSSIEAINEASLIFSRKQVEKAIQIADGNEIKELDCEFERIKSLFGRNHERLENGFGVLGLIILRICSRLTIDLQDINNIHLIERIEKLANVMANQNSLRLSFKRNLTVAKAIIPPLHEAVLVAKNEILKNIVAEGQNNLSKMQTFLILDWLQNLTSPGTWKFIDYSKFISAMCTIEVWIDEWESIIIESTMKFFLEDAKEANFNVTALSAIKYEG